MLSPSSLLSLSSLLPLALAPAPALALALGVDCPVVFAVLAVLGSLFDAIERMVFYQI